MTDEFIGGTWRDKFGPEAEKRLQVSWRGTAAEMFAALLIDASAEQAEAMLPRLERAFADDPRTLQLARAVVDRKRNGGSWGEAVTRLRRRGEKLEARARRSPRTGAARLVGAWGGRRWRRLP